MNNMKKEQLRLYAVTDRTWLGNETLYEQVEKALEGGATLVQLREKELPEADVQKEAEELLELCHRYGVKLILDDDVELAAKVGADGVHIGQSDMGLAHAREILGPDKIIGVTAKTVEQAKAAEAGGADYLGSGAQGIPADLAVVFHRERAEHAEQCDDGQQSARRTPFDARLGRPGAPGGGRRCSRGASAAATRGCAGRARRVRHRRQPRGP